MEGPWKGPQVHNWRRLEQHGQKQHLHLHKCWVSCLLSITISLRWASGICVWIWCRSMRCWLPTDTTLNWYMYYLKLTVLAIYYTIFLGNTGKIINKIRWKPYSGNFLSSVVQGLGFLKVKAQIQNLVSSSTYSEVQRSISVKITGNITNNSKLITNSFHLWMIEWFI